MSIEELEQRTKEELISLVLEQQAKIEKLLNENYALERRVINLYEI